MKIRILTIILIISGCSARKQFLNEIVVNHHETTYVCKSDSTDNPYNSLLIRSYEVTGIQHGIINVSIEFDAIRNKSDALKILNVNANWIRIKDSKTDSIIINQSLLGDINDVTILKYKNELLTQIKKCNCTVLYFNDNFIPRKIGYSFKFVVLNPNIQ